MPAGVAVRWYVQEDLREDPLPRPVWPEAWPLPSIGHGVYLENGECRYVTAVDWYPQGEDGDGESFVYIVLKQYRGGSGLRE